MAIYFKTSALLTGQYSYTGLSGNRPESIKRRNLCFLPTHAVFQLQAMGRNYGQRLLKIDDIQNLDI